MQTLGDTAPGLTLAILVLGADFNVSAEERRTLSQLVWHLIRKNNEFVVKDLEKVDAKDSQVDIVSLIRVRCCLLYTSPSPRDRQKSRMPSSA